MKKFTKKPAKLASKPFQNYLELDIHIDKLKKYNPNLKL